MNDSTLFGEVLDTSLTRWGSAMKEKIGFPGFGTYLGCFVFLQLTISPDQEVCEVRGSPV